MTAGAKRGGAAGRLLLSGPGTPAENMAIDAAILAAAEPGGAPTLRFYAWSEPTLSLGYFQPWEQRSRHAQSSRLSVVRRATGGGAIVHDRELTYSLVSPHDGRRLGAEAALYRAVHDAFAACLADWGIGAVRFADSGGTAPAADPFLCFERRTDEDLIVNGYKVLGSAQRRGRCGLLQHGSLLLAASRSAPQLPGIRELSGRTLTPGDFFRPISQKLGTLCDVQWTEGQLSVSECAAAERIAREKFSADRWTRRNREPSAGVESKSPMC